MKVITGIVLAGAVAAVLAVVSGRGNGNFLPAEKPKSRFSTPVTDAGAQWKREGRPYAGVQGISGYLDGPRHEMLCLNVPSIGRWFETGNDFTVRQYNPENERYYTVAGRATGYLDGPLSRARFGSIGYMYNHAAAGSPDGRFLYFTEPDLNGVLRIVDFEKQTVATLSTDLRCSHGMTADSKGNLYGLSYGDLTIVNPQGKILEKRKMGFAGAGDTRRLFGAFCNITLDEVHNRLYAANRAPGGAEWTIWYWDLANDNKFVGVLPIPKKGEPTRTLNETGPFKGTKQRCPGGVSFGPLAHNPDHRYLYQGGGDNTTFYRLNLEKKMIDTFGPVNPSERRPYKTLGWVQAKWLPFNSISKWCGCPTYDDEGNIYLGVGLSGIIIRFTRVK